MLRCGFEPELAKQRAVPFEQHALVFEFGREPSPCEQALHGMVQVAVSVRQIRRHRARVA